MRWWGGVYCGVAVGWRCWRGGGGRAGALPGAVGVAAVAWVEVCVEAVQAGQGAVVTALAPLGMLQRAVLFSLASGALTVGTRLWCCS